MLVASIEQLNSQTSGINNRISKAHAKIEISETLWPVASDQAKVLLVDALRLTFPLSDEKLAKGKEIAKGLFAPSQVELARRSLRNNIFRIAAPDREFRDRLNKLLVKELGESEKSQQLANDAMRTGDLADAAGYLRNANSSGEFGIDTGNVIYAVALRDREAADRLVLETLAKLRFRTMSHQMFRSTVVGLDMAVFGPQPFLPIAPVATSANAVIKEYLSFQLDKIREIGRAAPGGPSEVRGSVTSLWPKISRHAPELIPRFQLLEVETRINPNDSNLPEPLTEEKQKEQDDAFYEKAENSRKVSDIEYAVRVAVTRKNFAKAKDMVGLFDDLKMRAAWMNKVRSSEATYAIKKKELDEAEKIVGLIDDTKLALEAYAILIPAFKTGKQQTRSRDALFDVLKRLGSLGNDLSAMRPLSRLINAAIDIDSVLAFDLLSEMIKRLNQTPFEQGSDRMDFDPDSFGALARIDFDKSRLSAEILSDPLRRIVALSYVYRIKTGTLSEQLKQVKPIKKSEGL